ncbi:E3 ubiquitin-protein ligase TRIM21-like [Symsagittifera roscoffensis]|uniref:E3 ubiquitin-protein ligase TRIM21-like n=1 Tax=Symsagittifera roscoffensis TaxID=84072 RepID=UPI00307B968E
MEDFECSICCDTLDDPRLLPCGHMFCGPERGCILALNRNDLSADCPNCRKTHHINVSELQPIYVLMKFPEGLKIADTGDKQTRSVSAGAKSCVQHSDMSLVYFCDTFDISICDLCWGNDHSEHKVVLTRVKQKKDLLGAMERVNLESSISVYEKVIADNQKRRQLMAEVLTEIDVVNELLRTRAHSLRELNELWKEYVGLDSSSSKVAELGEKLMEDLKGHERNNKDEEIKKSISQISKESQKKFKTFANLCDRNEKTLNEMKQPNKQVGGLKSGKPEVSTLDALTLCLGSDAEVDFFSLLTGAHSSESAGPLRPGTRENRLAGPDKEFTTKRDGGTNQCDRADSSPAARLQYPENRVPPPSLPRSNHYHRRIPPPPPPPQEPVDGWQIFLTRFGRQNQDQQN